MSDGGGGSDGGPSDGGGSSDGGASDGGNVPDGGPSLDGGAPDGGPLDGGTLDGSVSDGGASDGSDPSDGSPLSDANPSDGPACVLAPEYAGQSSGLRATGLLVLDAADTGSVALTSHPIDVADTDISASVPGVIDLQALAAALTASGSETSASVEVAAANGNLIVPNAIAASVIGSEAHASCNGSTPVLTGKSVITDLLVEGIAVHVDGSPNQEIAIPGLLSIIINEQIPSVAGSTGQMTVNALHVTLLTSGEDLVVSSSRAEIECLCEN